MPPRASRAKAAPVPPPPELETLDLRAEECHDLKGIEGMSRDSMHTLLIALGIPFEPRWVKKDLAPLLREALFKKLFFVTVECDRANKSGVLRVPRTTPISECIKMTNDMLARHGYVVNDATMVLTHGGERVESLLDVDFGAPLSIIGSYRQLAQVSQPAASSEDARDVAHDPGEMFLIWVKCPVAEFTGVASCAVTRGIKVYNNTYMAEVRYMLPTLEIAAKTQDYALTFRDEILCDTATICSKGIKPLNTIVMRPLFAAVASTSSAAAAATLDDDFVADPPSDKDEPATPEEGEEAEGDAEEGEEDEQQEQDEEEEPLNNKNKP